MSSVEEARLPGRHLRSVGEQFWLSKWWKGSGWNVVEGCLTGSLWFTHKQEVSVSFNITRSFPGSATPVQIKTRSFQQGVVRYRSREWWGGAGLSSALPCSFGNGHGKTAGICNWLSIMGRVLFCLRASALPGMLCVGAVHASFTMALLKNLHIKPFSPLYSFFRVQIKFYADFLWIQVSE